MESFLVLDLYAAGSTIIKSPLVLETVIGSGTCCEAGIAISFADKRAVRASSTGLKTFECKMARDLRCDLDLKLLAILSGRRRRKESFQRKFTGVFIKAMANIYL